MKDTVKFNLQCPPGMSIENHHLTLIDYLVTELRKYTTVEIINAKILEEFKDRKFMDLYRNLFSHCVQRANIEGIGTMPEYFMRHPVEEMHLSKEHEAGFREYVRQQGCIK